MDSKMFGQREVREERISHNYERVEDSYDSSLSGGTTTTTTYRPSIAPRVTNIQRSRPSAFGAGSGVTTRVYQSMHSSGGGAGGFGGGLASLANFSGVPMRGSASSSTALVGFNSNRQRDKRDLVHLNDKFAQYVEKVRFLEAQNRKLAYELEALQKRAGQGSSRIKEMYEIEMNEAKKLIDVSKQDAAAAKIKAQQSEQEQKRQEARYNQVSGLRETDRKEIDALQRQIAENEAQSALFRRRLADLDDEARRYKGQSQHISAEITRLRNELQTERFQKSAYEVEKMSVEDELETIKQSHESELNELRSRTVSTDLDPSQFFRNELAQAIREIRADYENVLSNQRNELQNKYSLQMNELIIQQQRPGGNALFDEQQRRQEDRVRSELLQVQNENGYIKAKNQDMKNRVEELTRKLNAFREEGNVTQGRMGRDIDEANRRLAQADRDYNEVMNLKTSLEKEIGTYRDLLESQNGLRGYVDRIVQNAEQQAIDRPGGRAGGGGGTTTITRTLVSSSGSGYNQGGSSGISGISSLASQSIRPSGPTYSTLATGFSANQSGFSTNQSSFSTTHGSGHY